jgi:hypothetical protein
MASAAVATQSVETKQRAALASVEAAPDSSQLKQAWGATAGLPRFLGGGCQDCKSGIQPKLIVGTTGDRFEREADRIAEAVSGPAQPQSQPQTELNSLRTPSVVSPAIRTADSGAPLPTGLRNRIEPVLGASLKDVRVHDSAADREIASGLQAKAFTHGSHIWLGPSQSSGDLKLMAHEAAHVAQQGAAGPGAPPVQRLADDSAGTKPSPAILRNMLSEIPANADRDGEKKPHRAEYLQKKNELLARGKPAVDTANSARPKLERAATEVSKNSKAPAQPKAPAAGAPKTAKADAKGKGKGGPRGARKHARIAPRPPPAMPAQVQLPKIEPPKDSAGQALTPDARGDAQILRLAAMAQAMRMQGFALRQRAAQEHHNAGVIQGNMAKAQEGIAQADEGIGKSEDHLSYRREVAGQTEGVLHISEQKAEMVASEAPKYQSKSAEGKAKSGPMSGEAKGLAKENAENTPDDDDAGEESQEQGQKINQVGADIGTMDDAMGKTQAKADSLAADAAHAKENNEQTRGNVAKTQDTLTQTGAKLGKMSEQSAHAQAQLDAHAAGPGAVAAGAASLDQQGEAAIQASMQMEQRLHAVQQNYLAGMRSVPKSKRDQAASGASAPVLVQRQADPAAAPADGRVNLNLAGKVGEALPSWLSGEEKQSDKDRAEAQAAEKKRREDEIKEINDQAGGNFNKLSSDEKAGIALSLTVRHLFGSVAGIKWPNFLGKMLQGLIDPRIALMGIVSGLSMTLSGAANLLSAEQWKKDPLGNLLKSAADIATGITIILGSITALAMAIIAILVAAAIFSLGALGPVAAAVIPFCWTVVGTVGPWTITAAAIALELNALLLIKDLVDASTADTAEKLEDESDKVTDDAKTAGNMALQIGLAAVGEAGGEALASTEFGKGLASGMRDVGEEFGIVKPTAEVAPAVTEGAPAAAEGAPAKPPGAPAADAAPAPKSPESAPSSAEATTEGRPPADATAAGEAPKASLEEGIVAEQPAVDGHTVKVNEAGECLVCTDCVKLGDSVDADLAASEVPPAEKAQIEAEAKAVDAIEDPAAKAKAGAEVKAEAVQAAEAAPRPARMGTVSAGPEGIVEHPVSTPEVETAPPRRGDAPEPETPGSPEPGPAAAKLQELQQLESMQRLLERMDEKGLTLNDLRIGSEEDLVRFLGDDPEAGIAELEERVNVKETQSEAEAAATTKDRVDSPGSETGTRGMEIREAHDIGVEHGRKTAIEVDKLIPEPWENPLGHRGGFGQGIDDIMQTPGGDPVVVEYKGGSGDIIESEPTQMSREWVQTKIDELRAAGDTAMADKLQTALDAGKLQGRVYRTPLDANRQPLPTMRDPPIYYAPK